MTAPWHRFTDEQRRAAFLVDRSVIATAAAGSGKTQVMAVRYCACLLRDAELLSPERVLAITFTREAAANLRSRIESVLRSILSQAVPSFPDYLHHEGEDADLTPSEIQHLQRALEQLASAPIGTVDSFCLGLVSDHADRLGRDPGVSPPSDNGPEWRQCQEAAWLTLRAEAVRDPAGPLSLLVAAYGESMVRMLVTTLAEQCASLPQDRAYADHEDVLGRFLRLRQPQRELLHATLADVQEYLSAAPAKGAVAERLRAIPPPPEWSSAADAKGAEIYVGWLAHFDELKATVKDSELLALVLQLQDALDYPSRRNADGSRPPPGQRLKCASLCAFAGWDAADEERYRLRAEALSTCVGHFRVALEAASASRNLSGFTTTARESLRLLSQPEIAAAQAERFRHVLLDEAQDLNSLQGALIERIWSNSPAPRIFAVGDHRQSIYGFRHADPALFRSWEATVESRGGACAPLGRNFRSHPLLVTEVRRIFATRSLSRAFQVEGIRPGREVEQDAVMSRFNCWHAMGDDGTMAEAQLVANLISESIVSGRQPEHHAVLLRTRARMRLYADHLEQAGIPVDTDFPEGLYHSQECWDIEAILRLCLNPHDRFALACAVSGPWGCPDAQDRSVLVEALSLATTPEGSARIFTATPIGGLVQRVARILACEGPAAAIRLLSCDSRLTRRYGALPLARRRLANLARLSQEDLGAAGGDSDAVGFIARLSERRRLGADGAEAGGEALGSRGVHLRTIHAAKGLEYPVVILPEMACHFQDRERRRVAAASASPEGLAISCGAAGDESSCGLARFMALEALGVERRAEDARLFYVACTRAVDELHLIRSGKHLPAQEVRCNADWVDLADMPWNQRAPRANTPQLMQIASQRMEALPALPALPAATAVARPQVRTVSELISPALQAGPTTTLDAESSVRRAIGIRIHESLQRHGLGMSPTQAAAVCAPFTGMMPAAVLSAFTQAMSSRTWLGPWPQATLELRELPLVCALIPGEDRRLVTGVVDLLRRDDQGSWHLFDYKSGDTAGAENDQLQVQAYAHMCAGVLAGGVASAHILDLRRMLVIDVPLHTPVWPRLVTRYLAVESASPS